MTYNERGYFTISLLAEYLNPVFGLTEEDIKNKIESGEIKGEKKMNRWYIYHMDLTNFLTKHNYESDKNN